jgi:predicted ATP-dependent protease
MGAVLGIGGVETKMERNPPGGFISIIIPSLKTDEKPL